MDRKAQRDAAYKLIFEYLVTGNDSPHTLSELSTDYIARVFGGVIERKDELNALIEKHAESSVRLFPADRAALLLAVYEILYEEDIPPAVSCNEAVELVKIYSTKKSPGYVNGVLSGITKNVRGGSPCQ